MRFISFSQAGKNGVAVLDTNGSPTGSLEGNADDPGELDAAVARGTAALREADVVLATARPVDLSAISYRPVLGATSSKLVCVGLNFKDHSAESGYELPNYPPLVRKAGDVCEVKIEGLGVLRQPVADAAAH